MKKLIIIIVSIMFASNLFVLQNTSFKIQVSEYNIKNEHVVQEKSNNASGYSLYANLSKQKYGLTESILVTFTYESETNVVSVDFINAGFEVIQTPILSGNNINTEILYNNIDVKPKFTLTLNLENGMELTAYIYGVHIEGNLYISSSSYESAKDEYYTEKLQLGEMSQREYEIAIMNEYSSCLQEYSYNSTQTQVVNNEGQYPLDNDESNEQSFNSNVSGVIRWKDDSSVYHPLQYAKVTLHNGTDNELGVAYTDKNGNYNICYDNFTGHKIYIKIHPESANGSKVVTNNENDYILSGNDKWANPGSSLVFNYNITMDNDAGQAFQIFQAIVTAENYALEMMDSQGLLAVTAKYPVNSDNCSYDADIRHINIIEAYGATGYPNSYASWDVIMHEYGHHIQRVAGNFSNNPGGKHYINVNMIEENIKNGDTLANAKDKGLRIAWAEGWANVFGAAAQRYFAEDLTNIATVGDSIYLSYNESKIDYVNSDILKGDACEISIAGALWCLYADEAEYDDIPSLTHQEAWDLIVNSGNNGIQKIKNFPEFVAHFYSEYPNYQTNFGKILHHFNIPPGELEFKWENGDPIICLTVIKTWGLTNYSIELEVYNEDQQVYFIDFDKDCVLRGQILKTSLNLSDYDDLYEFRLNYDKLIFCIKLIEKTGYETYYERKFDIISPNILEYELTEDGENYSVIGLKNSQYAGKIYIPDIYNEKEVVEIKAEAFKDCTGITEVYMYSNIEKIGAKAFYGCIELAKVTILWKISLIEEQEFEIREQAFENCVKLVNIETKKADSNSSKITTIIGYRAFYGCILLSSLRFNDKYEITIEGQAFGNCSNLYELTIEGNILGIGQNAFLGTQIWERSEDNLVIFKDWILGYKGTLDSVIYIDEIVGIADFAFYDCDDISNIKFPNIKYIGEYAFSECSNLISVAMGTYLKAIGRLAFSNCEILSCVTIKDALYSNGITSLVNIEEAAFWQSDVCFLGQLTIYTNLSKKPETWHEMWNSSLDNNALISDIENGLYDPSNTDKYYIHRPVFWGCTLSNDSTYVVSFTRTADNIKNYDNAQNGIADPMRLGYTFEGWYTDPDYSGEKYTTNQLISASAGNKFYARWVPNTYSIEYRDIGDFVFTGNHEINYPRSYTSGEEVVLDEPSRIGYIFKGWYLDSNCTKEPISQISSLGYGKNIVLYAKWEANIYNITYKDKGNDLFSGVHIYNCPTKHIYGINTILGTPIHMENGYIFEGWYLDVNCIGEKVSMLSATAYVSEIVLYAKWSPKTYAIEYYDMGKQGFTGIHEEVYPIIHTYNEETTLDIPTKRGHTFEGWYLDENCTGEQISILSATLFISEVVLYAKWIPEIYEIEYYDVSGQVFSGVLGYNSPIIHTYGVDTQLVIPHKEGFEFFGWYLNENGLGEAIIELEKDKYIDPIFLYAVWEYCDATEGLEYNLILDGTAYEVGRGSATDTTIVIPYRHNGLPVIRIKDNGFYDSNITDIKLSENIQIIGYGAFSYCSSLQNVTIEPNSSLTYIDYYAFRNCNSLQSIVIPASVTFIGQGAFWNCTAMGSVTFEDGIQLSVIQSSVFENCSSLESITIPNSVETISSEAFYGCTFESFTIPANVTYISPTALGNNALLMSITVANSNVNYCALEGILYDYNKTQVIKCPEGKEGTITLQQDIQAIGNYAFYGCSGVTSISIPAGVTNIGNYSFYNCTSLESFTIAEESDLNSIGNYAFYGCSELTSIAMPASVTGIGEYAFYGCTVLNNVALNEGLESIGKLSFVNCTSLSSISIPSSVTSIGDRAFYLCSSMHTINVAEGNSKYCVEDNVLYSVNEENGSVYYTVEFCPQQTQGAIELLENTSEIKEYAFFCCGGVTSVTIPIGVTKIDAYAFYGCAGIMSVTIPATVTVIGNYAFYNCASLESFTIAEESALNSIGYYAFANCSIVEIEIPVGVVEMGSYVFAGWESGQIINIAAPITVLETWSMDWITNSDAQVEWINNSYENGTIGLQYTLIDYGTDGGYEVSVGNSITSIYMDIVIPATYNGLPVVKIADYGFYDLYELENVIILGTNLVTIGRYAFAESNYLKKINIPNSVMYIEEYAFMGCRQLNSINLSSTLVSIGFKAFEYCADRITFTVSDWILTVDYGAFNGKYTIFAEVESWEVYGWNLDQMPNCTIFWNCELGDEETYVISIGEDNHIISQTYWVAEPYREGYEFMGWTTEENSTVVEYSMLDLYQGEFMYGEDLKLYAVWEPIVIDD